MVIMAVTFMTVLDRMCAHPGLPGTVPVYLSCQN